MKRLSSAVLAASLIGVPVTAAAEAPVYFDIFSGLGIIGGYVLGVILLLVAIAKSSASGRWKLGLALAAYLVGPPAYLTLEKLHSQIRAAELEQQRKQARFEAEGRLVRLCHESEKAIHIPACQRFQTRGADQEQLVIGR